MYKINEKFFETPQNWTQDEAYLLGWLTSDGYCSKKGQIRIALQEKDKRILEILKDIIKYEGPLHYMKRNTVNDLISSRSYKWQNRWGLSFRRDKITNDLNQLGITNNKSNDFRFPDYIKEDLLSHFLRSYYEGDGTISYSFDKKNYKYRLMFEIHLIGTKNFCTKVSEILKNKLNIDGRLDFLPLIKNNSYRFRFAGNYKALKFFNFIYKDANFVLKRKFKKFLRLINYLKKKPSLGHGDEQTLKIKTELDKAIATAKNIIKFAKY